MNIKFWNQPKSINLGAILNEKLRKGFEKVWIISGMTKDTGMDVIYDSLELARKDNTEINMFIGIDRKNTSKDMLMKLIGIGCNISVHINRDDNKVETRIYIFENKNGESYVYISSGKFSEGGLLNNHCLIQEIVYLSEDKKLYENFKTVLMQGLEDGFTSIGEDEIRLLAEKGEIVARITERKIPSISEMYGEPSINTIANDVYDESSSSKLFEIPDEDFNIDIDIEMGGEIKKAEFIVESEAKKQSEETKNIEEKLDKKLSKLFDNKSEITTDEKKTQIVKDTSEIDFSKMSIFVFELNKINTKGVGEGEIKIPHSLSEQMSDFLGKDFKLISDNKGKERFGNYINLEILDVGSNDKFKEEKAFLYDTDRYLAIKSLKIQELNPDEDDIVRLIKKNENEFAIELIRKGMKEYEIWESFCKYTMKNSKRRFGIM